VSDWQVVNMVVIINILLVVWLLVISRKIHKMSKEIAEQDRSLQTLASKVRSMGLVFRVFGSRLQQKDPD
jgi:uncharacterized protein YoxC